MTHLWKHSRGFLCLSWSIAKLDGEGRMTVNNDTTVWYRYIDMTPQAEALSRFIERTVDTELAGELDFLANYDRAKHAFRKLRTFRRDRSLYPLPACKTTAGFPCGNGRSISHPCRMPKSKQWSARSEKEYSTPDSGNDVQERLVRSLGVETEK